jgi:hypothetical protein
MWRLSFEGVHVDDHCTQNIKGKLDFLLDKGWGRAESVSTADLTFESGSDGVLMLAGVRFDDCVGIGRLPVNAAVWKLCKVDV